MVDRPGGKAMEEQLSIIEVTPANLGDSPCCGIKNIIHEGHRCKTAWMAKQFKAGLRAKILLTADNRQCGYIEYLPGEQAWRGVKANGYMFIHCIWTFYKKHQHRGNAIRLVHECMEDARKAKMLGVAVVARRQPWLASSDLFLKCGFDVVDAAPPDYELLARKFRKNAPSPGFLPAAPVRTAEYASGLTIIRANQCPHGVKFAREIGEIAEREFKLHPRQVILNSARDAQKAPTPYAVFTIIYDGKILSDHQISKTRFRNIMKEMDAGARSNS
jgi:hypothetical protein